MSHYGGNHHAGPVVPYNRVQNNLTHYSNRSSGGYSYNRQPQFHPYNMRRGHPPTGPAYNRNSRYSNMNGSSIENLKPGPFSSCALPPHILKPIKHEQEYELCAARFFHNELQMMEGEKEITYESVRKFGKFKMVDGVVVTDTQYVNVEEPDNCLEGMSKLWQIGDGFIYIRQKVSSSKIHVSIYRITKREYEKLSSKEVAEMVNVDPFFEKDRKTKLITFV